MVIADASPHGTASTDIRRPRPRPRQVDVGGGLAPRQVGAGGHSGRSRRRWAPAVVAAYALGAWLLYLPLGLADSTHIAGAVDADQADQVWFLALGNWCALHFHLAPFTSLIDYPQGVNLLDNAGMPLLALLMAPVTAVLGPVSSFALLMRLSFVVSAGACYFVLRRVVRSDLAAAVGGAFYGFSPYMTHQAQSHVFLVFVPLPPVIFLIIRSRLCAPWARQAFSRGLLLGGLTVAQYLICSEIAVSTVVVASLTLAGLAGYETLAHRSVRSQARAVRRLATGFAVVALPLLVYPAWYALAGPQHVVGPTQSVTSPGIDVLSAVLPADRALLAGMWPGWRLTPLPLLGDTAFLGVPLLVVLAWVAITGWRSGLVRAATFGGGVAWILALGPRLVIDGHITTIPLPFALFTRVPVVQDIIPNRFTLYVDLAAAVLLAMGADRLIARVRLRLGDARSLLALIAVVGSVVPSVPVAAYPAVSIGAAQAFDGVLAGAIPAGAVVLAYPYPSFPDDQAMLWQALAGMQFSLLGGYAVRPGPDGGQTHAAVVPAPASVPDLLLQAWSIPLTAPPSLVAAAAEQLPSFVIDNHVSAVVIERAGANPAEVVALFSAAFGAPRVEGAFDLWIPGPDPGS